MNKGIIIALLAINFNAFADVNIGAQLKNGLQVDDVAEFVTADGERRIRRVYKEADSDLELNGLIVFKENRASSEYHYSLQASLLLNSENKTTADGVTGYLATIYGTYPMCFNTVVLLSISSNKILISAQSTEEVNNRVAGNCLKAEDLIGEFNKE